MLAWRLERAGFAVVCAKDGQEAIDLAIQINPVVILMDVGLPGFDGWQVTRILKVTENTKHIPVIALTANALAVDRDRSFVAGCDEYQPKPINYGRLVEKLNALSF
ncbi:MAG: response regulator [Alphaproteobacteria bacterium]|nr:response regulator [Alphaproteobacteria bacterium]